MGGGKGGRGGKGEGGEGGVMGGEGGRCPCGLAGTQQFIYSASPG